MTSAFSTDVRILACPSCGAPVHSSPVGGLITCDHCRAMVQVAPRDDTSLGRPAGPMLTDAERWQGLWSQAQSYSQQALPQEWIGVIPVTAPTLAQALNLWQGYCRAAAANDTAAATHLAMITGAIANYFGSLPDNVRRRSLFESAMEALPSPFGKQVMRGQLARAAVAEGDLEAGRVWLAALDPNSPDVEADTAYRLTYACLATAYGDFPNVITVLGPERNSIPVVWTNGMLVDVYRANAVEKLGDVNKAAQQLVASGNEARGGQGTAQIPEIIRRNTLVMCPQSLPLAVAEWQRHHR
jgi:hypothetical protein